MRNRTARRIEARHPGCEFIANAGSRHPFARANALVEKISATFGLAPLARQLALNALPEYTSRGHGGRHRTKCRVIGGQWSQDRSKYTPGCGVR